MAMGKKKRKRQQSMWMLASELPTAPGHPFYARLNAIPKASVSTNTSRAAAGSSTPMEWADLAWLRAGTSDCCCWATSKVSTPNGA
jgi:hypothetical protein